MHFLTAMMAGLFWAPAVVNVTAKLSFYSTLFGARNPIHKAHS